MNNSEHNCVSLKNAAFLFLFAFLEEILEIFEEGKECLKIRFLSCSSSGSPRRVARVNQDLGDVASKTGNIGSDDKEERSPKEREEMRNCFEIEMANGNSSKDSNWNCVDAKMNVVVETHF